MENTTKKMNAQLCDLLGIDPTKVYKVQMTLTTDDAPQMLVWYRWNGTIEQQPKKYKLTEVE